MAAVSVDEKLIKEDKKLEKEKELRNAAYHGQLVPLNRLIHERVDVAAVTPKEGAPKKAALRWAVERGHIECVKALLKAGADPLQEDEIGQTAVGACQDPNILAIIQESVLSIDRTNLTSHSYEYRELKKILNPKRLTVPRRKLQELQFNFNKMKLKYEHLILCLSKTFAEETQAKEVSIHQSFEKMILKFDNMLNISVNKIETPTQENYKQNAQFMYGLLQLFVTEYVNFEYEFQEEVQKALHFLDHHKDKYVSKQLSRTKRHIDVVSKLVTESLKEIVDCTLNIFKKYYYGCVSFLAFVRKYFPRDLIRHVIFTSGSPPTSLEERLALHELILNSGEVIETQSHAYERDIMASIPDFLEARKAFHDKMSPLSNNSPYHDVCKNSIELAIQNAFEKLRSAIGNRWGANIYTVFLLGHYFSKLMSAGLDDAKTMEEFFRLKFMCIRQNYLSFLTPKPPTENAPDHAEVVALEKKINNEIEGKKRDEARLEKTYQATLTHQKKLMDEMARKKRADMGIRRKSLLNNLDAKRDAEEIKIIAELFTTPDLPVKRNQFFRIVARLKIPGFEKIDLARMSVRGNCLTLTLDKFYSFTTHCRHGVDRADFVHPEDTRHLVRMLTAVDLNVEDFLRLGAVKVGNSLSAAAASV